MKFFKDFLICLGFAFFFIGAYICIPFAGYDRTVVDGIVYSDRVVEYPTAKQNVVGASMIIGGLLLAFLGVITQTKKNTRLEITTKNG